ncbi:uncharacterized protein LOC131662813 isoform X2 [Phymastichus coffea]|uniref:uncharacterized protein LOC131662813 isoform X2 n=1 Tax=Phymastichus coffea TaxID=108790 RepID=UPI00273AE82A|nr:uncharacterized protein LOC131662813 isoform X2 [Phymastichus coffea]
MAVCLHSSEVGRQTRRIMAPRPCRPSRKERERGGEREIEREFAVREKERVCSAAPVRRNSSRLLLLLVVCVSPLLFFLAEEPATLSTLNEGELRALLDEAITYKCPKDREGKSNLFKELLQEAEADESEESHWASVTSSAGRCLPRGYGGGGAGASSRRHNHRRCGDSVSEHLTHGGSLQNLAHDDFDSTTNSLAYLASSGHPRHRGNLKASKKSHSSVSARQREGGSLPSNVNATHNFGNFDLVYERKKGLSEEKKSLYDWTNKEKSKSLDKPSYDRYSKKEDKEKDKKDSKLSGSCDIETELRDKRGGSNKGKLGANEMLDSDNPTPEYNKQDCVVSGLEDLEASLISEQNASAALGGVQWLRSLDPQDQQGTEMKVIGQQQQLRPVHFITRATLEVPPSDGSTVDSSTSREDTIKLDKSKINVNGSERTNSSSSSSSTTINPNALPLSSYNNAVKCVMGGPSSVYSVMWPTPSISMVSRLTAHHIAGKESSASGEKKSLDENGNAVQGYNGERKKPRRKNVQEPNVIVYQAENVEGHRDDEDIDSLLSFIENKECKSKKGKTSNSVKVKSAAYTKSRSRDNKDIKREQISTKLQKSNSLEEISKTKLEDLTTEKSTTSSGSNSVSSQHGPLNLSLRRAKQRSTGDTSVVHPRGDRRSWGTEEGQLIYCNDTGDDYGSRRNSVNSVKKHNVENEAETEFHVVTNKKKKTKKQRRSSSGSRAQNLSGSGSYLQRGRGFSNDFRTPLSPELRRKSASSMPPSDKSDSSDLDSVHSLPVTSNSSKHNSSKTANSSSNAPPASYADIARMASLNMSTNPVMNISNLMSSSLMNAQTWPSVTSSKNSPEAEKLPNADYYPSLDELQHSDRKSRQHSFAQQGASLSLDKPSSPTNSTKSKASPKNSKKTDEEAIKKVAKYVQDIEKMKQQQQQQHSQSQQDTKQSSNNSSPNSNDTTPTNPLPTKLPGSPTQTVDLESNSGENSSKDSSASSKNSARIRKTHPPGTREFSNTRSRSQADELRDQIKIQSHPAEEPMQSKPSSNPPVQSQAQEDVKEPKKVASSYNVTAGPSETTNEPTKPRIVMSSKPVVLQSRLIDADIIRVNKTDRLPKAVKDQPVNSKETTKIYYPQQIPVVQMNCRLEKTVDQTESKKSKQSNNLNKHEKEAKVPESQPVNKASTSTTSRPAVILFDENITDQARSTESESSELTFGFEVNEELLLSEEEDEETPMASPDMSRFSISPSNFNRQPPIYNKHVRIEKLPTGYQINPTYIPMHQLPPHPVIVQTMPFMNCQMRFQTPYVVAQHPPPPPPPAATTIVEKCRNQPKEDFSSRYIAPDENHVQKFNHDKIVSFVGLAWDDVMRESGSASSSRVQYYSEQ